LSKILEKSQRPNIRWVANLDPAGSSAVREHKNDDILRILFRGNSSSKPK
jgi:hypothetical protein